MIKVKLLSLNSFIQKVSDMAVGETDLAVSFVETTVISSCSNMCI